jgi:hypothetical protein
MWIKNWLSEVFLPQEMLFQLRGNNLGSISLTETNKEHGLSKHLDIRWHYIWERVKDGELVVSSIPGKENIADILMKALPHITHERIVGEMGLDWRRKTGARRQGGVLRHEAASFGRLHLASAFGYCSVSLYISFPLFSITTPIISALYLRCRCVTTALSSLPHPGYG